MITELTYKKRCDIAINCETILTLRRPLRRKVRMMWFFDISKEKESRFFNSDLNDPQSDF